MATDADVQRNLSLLVQLAVVALVLLVQRAGLAPRPPYAVPAAALGGLLAAGGIVAVEATTDLWSFTPGPTSVAGAPLETVLGWALLWGVLPGLAGGRWWCWVAGFAWLDLLVVPRMAPLVELGPRWWVGEGLLLALVAAPAAGLALLTRHRAGLGVRVTLQAVTFGLLFMVLLPTYVLDRTGGSWSVLTQHGLPARALLLLAAAVPGVLALAAVAELARVGRGTPFPWDGPDRLVTTGPYAYLANPMQVGAVGLLVVLAIATASPALGAGAVVAGVFGEALAEPHERSVLGARWADHAAYRRAVPRWWPRWRPYVPEPATVWISRDCGPCHTLGEAVRRAAPTGLEVRAAEEAGVRLTRVRWVSGPDTDRGVAAVARALEHLSLPLAWCGWAVRLPGVCQVVQAVADGCGLGPREVGAPRSVP